MKQPAHGHAARECWSWAPGQGTLALLISVGLALGVGTGEEVSLALGIMRQRTRRSLEASVALNLQKSSEWKQEVVAIPRNSYKGPQMWFMFSNNNDDKVICIHWAHVTS